MVCRLFHTSLNAPHPRAILSEEATIIQVNFLWWWWWWSITAISGFNSVTWSPDGTPRGASSMIHILNTSDSFVVRFFFLCSTTPSQILIEMQCVILRQSQNWSHRRSNSDDLSVMRDHLPLRCIASEYQPALSLLISHSENAKLENLQERLTNQYNQY